MTAEWLFFFSAITTIIIPGVHAGLREMLISDRSSVTERTVISILESCYDGDSSSHTVVVFGDFNEFSDKLLMIRINSEDRSNHLFPDFKLTRVIIVFNSLYELQQNIMLMRGKSWWNHKALFFIISKNKQLCDRSHWDILIYTWQLGLINVIYICAESINTSVLHTMNGYANYAPHPWQSSAEFPKSSFFSQQYDKNISCSSLNYDKTKKLNHQKIRILVWQPPGQYFDPKRNYYPEFASLNGFLFKTIDTVCRALNSKCIFILRIGRDSAIQLLDNGVADLMYFLVGIEEYPNTKFLFPHSNDRIVAVLKLSSEKSTQNKILHLWGPSVIFLAFSALVILLLILLWKNHEFSSALLDIIRLMVYSSILTNIRSHSFRIVFTTILIMMIISNGVFQSKIAAFLTTHERNIPIERIETLVQLGYKLYNIPGLKSMIQSHCPQCNAMTVDDDDCINRVLENGLDACLTEELHYQTFASMPLDLVKEPLHETLLVTKCRNNWPLYDRMNDMWMRVFESGLPNFWETQQTFKSLRERQEEDIERSSTQYQPVKLYKLWFAFKFLAIGLSLSTIVFIAELLVKKYGNSTLSV